MFSRLRLGLEAWRAFVRLHRAEVLRLAAGAAYVPVLQRAYRRHCAARRGREQRALERRRRGRAATNIQATHRGSVVRRAMRRVALAQAGRARSAHAIVLQAAWRGATGRRLARAARRTGLRAALLRLAGGDLGRLDAMVLDPPIMRHESTPSLPSLAAGSSLLPAGASPSATAVDKT